MSAIPGITAKHAIITDACRSGRGDAGAFDEAVERLRAEYEACVKARSSQVGVNYHLVLSVEPPLLRKDG